MPIIIETIDIETIDTLHTQRAPSVPVTPPIPVTEAAQVPGMILTPPVPILQIPVAREKE